MKKGFFFVKYNRTSTSAELSSATKIGTAPASTTARVCAAVPEAMLVTAQAASSVSCVAVREFNVGYFFFLSQTTFGCSA